LKEEKEKRAKDDLICDQKLVLLRRDKNRTKNKTIVLQKKVMST